jgi:2-phospho-L-lactate/phosphoenolpyruvate guanylyltransferase
VKAILIPVKSFAESKTRLAPHYSAAERGALAGALCEDFFAKVAQVRGMDRVFVISQEPRALDAAKKNDWETIIETEQISESHSVDAASRLCAAQGVRALLRLPMDLALAQPSDIEAIFAEQHEAPSAVVIPSRDGTGTNALLRSPPTLFPSHFGPNSFALHLEAAESCGARIKILRNPRIELDVDEIEDLRALDGRLDADCATARWLARHPV